MGPFPGERVSAQAGVNHKPLPGKNFRGAALPNAAVAAYHLSPLSVTG